MTTATHARPEASEFAPFYSTYIGSVPDGNIVELMRQEGRDLAKTFADIPDSKGGHRYAEGKWSVREVLGHMIDAERIFTYRLLRIARGDETPLASFDQDAYVRTSGAESRTVAHLVKEMLAVRDSTVLMLESLSPNAWSQRGTASEKTISVRALAYVAAGHSRHHMRILHESYGI